MAAESTTTDAAQAVDPPHMSAVDPLALFDEWLAEAAESEPNDPNAVSLATMGEDGWPDVRTVLMKGHDERGFAFYTNFQGRKGRQLAANPVAAMNFHWKTRGRQVRLRGGVEIVAADEADAYYRSRGLGSRIGAWASEQSRPLESRAALLARVRAAEEEHGEAPPRPPHWGGFRLVPMEMEFWQDGEHRLHDRLQFVRGALAEPWTRRRLYP